MANISLGKQREDVPTNISFVVSIYSLAELKKKSASARKPHRSVIQLDSSKPFDTFVAQVLVKIHANINPKETTIENYDMTFSISRHQTDPVSLSSDSDYAYMLTRAKKQADPSVNVKVEQRKVQITVTYSSCRAAIM